MLTSYLSENWLLESINIQVVSQVLVLPLIIVKGQSPNLFRQTSFTIHTVTILSMVAHNGNMVLDAGLRSNSRLENIQTQGQTELWSKVWRCSGPG